MSTTEIIHLGRCNEVEVCTTEIIDGGSESPSVIRFFHSKWLNSSLGSDEDVFSYSNLISSESNVDEGLGNEVDAPCLLTCCNLININFNLSHVNSVSSEGLGNKAAAPCLVAML